jgi:hypothetical protein
MARKDIKKFDDESTGAFFTINQELQLWACNSTLKEKKAKIELVSFDLNGGEVDRQSFGGKLAPNASTEIWKGDVPGMFMSLSCEDEANDQVKRSGNQMQKSPNLSSYKLDSSTPKTTMKF